MRRLVPVFLLIVAVSACGASSDSSRAHSVETQVWSPYCPGRLLIDCTTQQARELRADIASRVDDGETADEILAWIGDEFGPQAIARPGGGATGLLIWLVPAAIFAVGAVFVVRAIRRGRPSIDERVGSPSPPDAPAPLA